MCVQKNIKLKKDLAWAKEWDNLFLLKSTKVYQKLDLKPSSNIKIMLKLKLKREVLRWFIAKKLGYGHFVDYHERFEYEKIEKQCRYRQRHMCLYLFIYSRIYAYKIKLSSKSEKK